MKFLKKILFFTAFLCFTTLVKAQYINVDDTKTATDLVNILTNNSSCVAVANATTKGDTFSPNKIVMAILMLEQVVFHLPMELF